jgi:hypothetical protein
MENVNRIRAQVFQLKDAQESEGQMIDSLLSVTDQTMGLYVDLQNKMQGINAQYVHARSMISGFSAELASSKRELTDLEVKVASLLALNSQNMQRLYNIKELNIVVDSASQKLVDTQRSLYQLSQKTARISKSGSLKQRL